MKDFGPNSKKEFSEFNVFNLFLSVILICCCRSKEVKLRRIFVTVLSLILVTNHGQASVLTHKGLLELEMTRTV